jgi:hypothetical protein
MAFSMCGSTSPRTAVFERFALSEASDRSRLAACPTSIPIQLCKLSFEGTKAI